MIAHSSGLPVKRFIAACNANDVVPRFMESGEMVEKPAVATLSNAMDVANPSNFVRILELFARDRAGLSDLMSAVSVGDEATRATMRDVHERFGYVLDPHGAVGFRALEDHLAVHPDGEGYFLETAHPVKFDSVLGITGTFGEVPDSVRELDTRPKRSVVIPPDYDAVRAALLRLA
jgi:threonine synthase